MTVYCMKNTDNKTNMVYRYIVKTIWISNILAQKNESSIC